MGILDFRRVPDKALPERLSEGELNATFVLVRKHDGTPLDASKIVVLTLTADESDIQDIAVYDSLEEVGS